MSRCISILLYRLVRRIHGALSFVDVNTMQHHWQFEQRGHAQLRRPRIFCVLCCTQKPVTFEELSQPQRAKLTEVLLCFITSRWSGYAPSYICIRCWRVKLLDCSPSRIH